MIESAVRYARRGWRIFPVGPDKRPLTIHGFRDASADAGQVERWWREHPGAGIGWAIPAEIFVLDIDARHRGHESLDELEREYDRLPPTLTQITGGGGLHYFYKAPPDIKVRQLAGLRDGIDTRAGTKGYVVLPPSMHTSGLPYAWSRRLAPVEAPAWLIDLIRVPALAAPAGYTPQIGSGLGGRRERYALAVLRGEAQAVAETGDGGRNDRLNRAWFRCAQFRDALDREHVRRELTAAAIASGLEQREIERVLR